MRTVRGKLRLIVGGRRSTQELTASERDESVERVLLSLGIESLPPDEQHVLRVIAQGLAAREPKKAVQIARETGLSLVELERVCDRLLDKGLIGPAPAGRRRA